MKHINNNGITYNTEFIDTDFSLFDDDNNIEIEDGFKFTLDDNIDLEKNKKNILKNLLNLNLLK